MIVESAVHGFRRPDSEPERIMYENRMKTTPKIYLETTLFNYYFDQDRAAHADTVKLFKAIAAGKYEGFTSDTVLDELKEAPDEKRVAMVALVEKYRIEILLFNEEVEKLANAYTSEGIIPRKYEKDGIHIAVATVNDMDFIASLNFRHIVNAKTARMTHAVNIRQGYRPVKIVSPTEMMKNENA